MQHGLCKEYGLLSKSFIWSFHCNTVTGYEYNLKITKILTTVGPTFNIENGSLVQSLEQFIRVVG